MKKIAIILGLFFVGFAYYQMYRPQEQSVNHKKSEVQEVIEDDFELYKPKKEIQGVLILFGGFPEVAADIKREFNILDLALKNKIAVVLINFNQRLWLEEDEKQYLAQQLENIFEIHTLPRANVYLGGFSSGGNVSLLLSSYLIGSNNFQIKPNGVFIADSPIDLFGLHKSSEKNVQRNFSDVSVTESKWIIQHLEENFGNPTTNKERYERSAVFTLETNNINNLKNLKNVKIRLYTEPDSIWWKENRKADFDQTNAYYIQQLSATLKKAGFNKVTYIPTENKGFRANGKKHPHSWSIIDKEELIDWILNRS